MLDNPEHLLGRGEDATLTRLISRILAEGPGVRLLATARERIRMRSERVILVSGLWSSLFSPCALGSILVAMSFKIQCHGR